jgi:predicted aspartyl protease
MIWLGCVALLHVLAASLVAQPRSQTTNAAQPASANSQDTVLKSLYEAHEWFKLYAAVQASDAPAFYRGAVAAAFNDFTQAEKNLKSAIKSSPQSEQSSDARLLLIQLYIRAGRYRQALYAIEQALIDSPADDGLKNGRALFGALGQYPEPSVAARQFSRIRYSMKGGNLFLPLEVDGKPGKFLVDSGANYSLISESEAKRLGLTISESRGAKIGDSSGANVDFRIAVADHLTVGKVRLRHVFFLVMRDDQQPFVDLPQGERGIIGFPVLLAFQTVRWNRAGVFEIGFAPKEKPGKPNIFFEGQNMIAEGEFEHSKINIFLDTGATHTRILPRFAREFSNFVNEFGKKGSQRITGVGSSVEVDSLTLPELKLRIRGPEVLLSPATVLLKNPVSDLRRCHVWIGMDLLNRASTVTLDFKAMTLALE